MTRRPMPLKQSDTATATGIIGAIYAVSGGLKAVAVSDCFNGIGLLVVGMWVPLAAISMLPNGLNDLFNYPENIQVLTRTCPVWDETTRVRADTYPSIPWNVVPFGMTMNNMYYWATNQIIVQRALGAESLAQGQKGVLFAACMKIIGFGFLCMPGILGVVFERMGIQDANGIPFVIGEKADTVYPQMVNFVMPVWSQGLFLGVLLGSVLSTFNSALNSASTMFSLEIYKIYIDTEATQESLVKVGGFFGIILALATFFIAPQFAGSPGIFNQLQLFNTIISLPILSVFFVGILTTLPDALAAKSGFIVGACVMLGMQALNPGNPLYDEAPAFAHVHFLHVFELAFLVAMEVIAIMTYSPVLRKLVGGSGTPTRYVPKANQNVVDMTPFASLHLIILGNAIALTTLLAVLQFASVIGFYIFWLVWFVVATLLILAPVPDAVPVDRKEAVGSFLASLRTNTFDQAAVKAA